VLRTGPRSAPGKLAPTGAPEPSGITPLTILDIVVIVVVLISATLAMVRGFVREVLSIASWLAAAAAAYFLYKPLVPLVRPYIESTPAASAIAAGAVFFIALIIASYVTTKISDFVIDSRVGAVDRALGFVFGAARGMLLMVIAVFFFGWLVDPPPTWVANAQSKPMLDDLGEKLKAALPEDIESQLQKFGSHDDDAPAPTDATPPADTGEETIAPVPGDPDYGTTTRQNLDQLIQNSDN
jgi:membrane protein required for colicin V production